MAWDLEPGRVPAQGSVAVVFAPMTSYAKGGRLTMREWDTLARLAGELEASGVEAPNTHFHEFNPLAGGGMIEAITIDVSQEIAANIRYKMSEYGLDENEWAIEARPHASYLWPLEGIRCANQILWHTSLHLVPAYSGAKLGAVEVGHAPTLAEQHGPAKA